MDGSIYLPDLIADLITVRLAAEGDRERWDEFVRADAAGTPFHLSAWADAVRKGLGYDTPGLLAEVNGEIVGVLPLVHVKTPLFGNSLVSTGFSVGGGVIALSKAAADALAGAAADLAQQRKVDCLELRSPKARFEGWPTKLETYAGFARDLDPDPEARLKSIPRKKRADVRKGIKAELPVRVGAPVEVFHDLYARNLHALGTPILPLRWYAALKEAFGEDCEIATVEADGRAVVALLSFYHEGTAYPYYVGALPEARARHAFDHAYWTLMERAVERGCTRFDFGRSKFGTGAFDYKKHWGFEGVALEYQYHLVRASAVPDVNPNNPKYAMFVKNWKRMPLGMTKLVGPFLAKQMG